MLKYQNRKPSFRVFASIIGVLIFISVAIIYFLSFLQTAIANPQTEKSNLSGCAANHFQIPINSFDNPNIFRAFDKNLGKYDPGHRGVDLLIEQIDSQNTIIAPIDGRILWKGVVADIPTFTFGNDEVKNTFQRGSTDLKIGTNVHKGQRIGNAQKQPTKEIENQDGTKSETIDGHCEDKECVHWGVINQITGEYSDPIDQVYRKRIVLKDEK